MLFDLFPGHTDGRNASQKLKGNVAVSIGIGCSLAIATGFGLAYGQSEDPINKEIGSEIVSFIS